MSGNRFGQSQIDVEHFADGYSWILLFEIGMKITSVWLPYITLSLKKKFCDWKLAASNQKDPPILPWSQEMWRNEFKLIVHAKCCEVPRFVTFTGTFLDETFVERGQKRYTDDVINIS